MSLPSLKIMSLPSLKAVVHIGDVFKLGIRPCIASVCFIVVALSDHYMSVSMLTRVSGQPSELAQPSRMRESCGHAPFKILYFLRVIKIVASQSVFRNYFVHSKIKGQRNQLEIEADHCRRTKL